MPKPKMNLRILNESILRRFDQIESYQSESGHHRENARVDFNYAIPRLDLHTDVKLTREAKPSIENPRLGLHPDITPTLSHRVSCKDGDIWLAGSAPAMQLPRLQCPNDDSCLARPRRLLALSNEHLAHRRTNSRRQPAYKKIQHEPAPRPALYAKASQSSDCGHTARGPSPCELHRICARGSLVRG